ncbi:hypothetical protein MASR2M78_03840 [Treponema sp.]
MQTIRGLLKLLSTLVLALFIGSCSNFFTNSLATPFARDKSKLVPSVNAGNVSELIKLSAQDPDLALVVLKKIETAIANASDADKLTLQAASIDAAANASGLGSAIFNSAGPIIDILSNGDLETETDKNELIGVVASSIGGLGNLKESADSLASIIPSPSDTVAFNAFVAKADPDQLAMAAIILLSSQANSSPGGTATYMESFDSESPSLNPQESLASELAVRAAQKYEAEGGTGPLADMLSALNLYNK